MTRYAVVVVSRVERQIIDRVWEIAADSIDNALAWEQRLRRAIDAIGDAPTGYRADLAASHRVGLAVRSMAFERTYLIFFSIDEAARTVNVIQFRHGARQPAPDEA